MGRGCRNESGRLPAKLFYLTIALLDFFLLGFVRQIERLTIRPLRLHLVRFMQYGKILFCNLAVVLASGGICRVLVFTALEEPPVLVPFGGLLG